MPLPTALGLMVREALTGVAAPAAAAPGLALVRGWVEGKADLSALALALDDQRAFQALATRLLEDLELIERERAPDPSDEDETEEEDGADEEQQGDEGEEGEEEGAEGEGQVEARGEDRQSDGDEGEGEGEGEERGEDQPDLDGEGGEDGDDGAQPVRPARPPADLGPQFD